MFYLNIKYNILNSQNLKNLKKKVFSRISECKDTVQFTRKMLHSETISPSHRSWKGNAGRPENIVIPVKNLNIPLQKKEEFLDASDNFELAMRKETCYNFSIFVCFENLRVKIFANDNVFSWKSDRKYKSLYDTLELEVE